MNPCLNNKIYELIKNVANLDISKIDASKPLREQISLDSMQFVTVIAAIEKEFNIELPISLMQETTLNGFLEKLEKVIKN
jgi:acyl carrier protein